MHKKDSRSSLSGNKRSTVHQLKMPRRTCYWTRKLELELVELVKLRKCIWKPIGNTNHHIQQKYKAYAEIAALLGSCFTARSVRDRWVNIRSTFNHNVRRVNRSKLTASSPDECYVPCWPLWKPLQFLKESSKRDEANENEDDQAIDGEQVNGSSVKQELQSDADENSIEIRQRGQRTDRPRHKRPIHIESRHRRDSSSKCKRVLNDLIRAISPLVETPLQDSQQTYWFFGKHVVERLNNMRPLDAQCASQEIVEFLNNYDPSNLPNT